MLVLDKARALDRMVWLADRKGNTPPEFLRPAPLRWTVAPGGRRALAGEVVLRPAVVETERPSHAMSILRPATSGASGAIRIDRV